MAVIGGDGEVVLSLPVRDQRTAFLACLKTALCSAGGNQV
jgi:hypothetical protein